MSSAHQVYFFGCYRYPGHYIHSKTGKPPQYEATPWGMVLDGGLLYDLEKHKYGPKESTPDGKYVFAQKGGWTAIAFWDRSGDERGASNSAFLIDAEVTEDQLFSLARAQWPEIFSRKGFPLIQRPADRVAKNIVFNEPEVKGPDRQPIDDNNDSSVSEQSMVFGTGCGKTLS